MKNLSTVFTLLLFVFLGSCSKENIEPTADGSTSIPIIDWATGNQVGSLEEVAQDRTSTNFNNHMSGATTKFGFQGDLYQGGVLIASTPWSWVTPGTSYQCVINADCGELTSRMEMHYKRKTPSIPCNLTISWSTNFNSGVGTETFTIGVNGTTKSHTFDACF